MCSRRLPIRLRGLIDTCSEAASSSVQVTVHMEVPAAEVKCVQVLLPAAVAAWWWSTGWCRLFCGCMVIRRDASVCIENAKNPLPVWRRMRYLLAGGSRSLIASGCVCLAKEKAYPQESGRAGYTYMSCPVFPGMLPASNFFQLRGPPEPLVAHQFSTPYYISSPRTCLVPLEPMQVLCICCPPESNLQICYPCCIILFVFSLAPAGFIWLWFPDTAGA